ncbi:MAG: sialidase family protein [Verrucomicrobiae bacterium]|nr:sialidase family protein [Verrucomicrobiae bacterium]
MVKTQFKIKTHEIKIISKTTSYHGWPTLGRRPDGGLFLVYSGGREAHVCPYGRVEMMRSGDGGVSWSTPEILANGPLDDRDGGILVTHNGSILVNWFTSLYWQKVLGEGGGGGFAPSPGRAAEWEEIRRRITPDVVRREMGLWMIRSIDGGATWSGKYPSVVNSPHGPVQLSDGRLIHAGKACVDELPDPCENAHAEAIGVAESRDDGVTWQWLASIPTSPGHEARLYCELHTVEADDGRLIAQIRNHNKRAEGETLQTESGDGGRTWSVPHSIGVWGHPSFLTRLRNGNLMMSYSHRRKSLGNQVRISADRGETWSEPLILSDDADLTDFGYPSTVELDDGTFLTVWYERSASNPSAVLRQARWKLGADGC